MVTQVLAVPTDGINVVPYTRLDLSEAQWVAYTRPKGLKNGGLVRSILKLGEICRAVEGYAPYNLNFVLRNKGRGYYPMTLRRCLDRIANAKSWRHDLKPKVAKHRFKPDVPKVKVFTLRDRIIDANNRFNVLLTDLYDEEVASHEFPWTVDEGYGVVDPFPAPPMEDRQYYTTAKTNSTRVAMRYKPKTIKAFDHPPSESTEKFREVVKTNSLYVQRTPVLALLKRLMIWRKAFSKRIENGGDIDDITPIALIEPIERWAAERVALGGEYHPLGGSMLPDLSQEAGCSDTLPHDFVFES